MCTRIPLDIYDTDLERELVHGWDLVEVVEDEVEEGGSGRGGPVQLAGLVDLHLGDLRLLHLLLDLRRRSLRRLKVLHQLVVTWKV